MKFVKLMRMRSTGVGVWEEAPVVVCLGPGTFYETCRPRERNGPSTCVFLSEHQMFYVKEDMAEIDALLGDAAWPHDTAGDRVWQVAYDQVAVIRAGDFIGTFPDFKAAAGALLGPIPV